ncbi:SDR family oxidoreductase [Chelativorans sp. ZYF759]|uniref:SDR family oxidoreductase n=1 Tax=Chelativorans sp. ZYF759 TaxID=2692213 RepID=UPI00210F685E|nr:SDR family oxidoreductase [Chelativorans sp. ZYF759]
MHRRLSRTRAAFAQPQLCRRLGTPEESGRATVFLLSDETSYLNGHDLVIDGARTVAT